MLRTVKIALDRWRWILLAHLTKGEKIHFSERLGLNLKLNTDWLIDFIIAKKGIFQADVMDTIEKELIRLQPELFIDVGAYIGQMGLYVKKKFPQIEVWLIEPQHALTERIRNNAILNRLDVKVLEIGVGKKGGSASVKARDWPIDEYGKTNPGAVDISYGKDANEALIPIQRLDELLLESNLAHKVEKILIKIDVENSECDALASIEGLFDSCSEIAVIIELNFSQQPDKQVWFDSWVDRNSCSLSSIGLASMNKPYQGDYLLQWKKA